MGTTYGVAKGASLVDLKVLQRSGSGYQSDFISAIDDLASLKRANPSGKYVLNASLGGPFYQPVNSALAALVATGVTAVVAAGNNDPDACSISPASEPSVITVGSTDQTDARSDFSDIGTCLDLFAPGSSILSATNTGDSDTAILSGTSMASPHVAGVAAVMLQLGFNPMVDLVNFATADVVTDPGPGSPNLLVYLPKAYVPGSPTDSPTTRRPTVNPTPRPTPTPYTRWPTSAPTREGCFNWIQDGFSSITGFLSGRNKADSP